MTAPAVIVLAAGASRRLGEPKALAEIAGRSALEHLLRASRALDPGPALVLTGADHDAIAEHVAARGLTAELRHRTDWASGRFGGLLVALGLRPDRDLAIASVDCPLVGPDVFAELGRAWAAAGAPDRGWLAPRLERPPAGRSPFGHPVVVGRELAGEGAGMGPDTPLTALRERADPLWWVAVTDAAVLDDLDRPEDLRRLREREVNRPSDRP